MVRLHEMWRQQYHVRRYMEFLTKGELEQRAKDVFNNLVVITGDVKIGLHPMHEEGAYWMELWTHVQEEFEIRFGPYPSGFDNGFMKNVRIPRPTSPPAEKAVRVAKQRRLQPGRCLIKYGGSKFLRETYETGAIRILPADAYSDPSPNPAVHDNELAISLHALPSETTLILPIHRAEDRDQGGRPGRDRR